MPLTRTETIDQAIDRVVSQVCLLRDKLLAATVFLQRQVIEKEWCERRASLAFLLELRRDPVLPLLSLVCV